jgi:hypothetical protein
MQLFRAIHNSSYASRWVWSSQSKEWSWKDCNKGQYLYIKRLYFVWEVNITRSSERPQNLSCLLFGFDFIWVNWFRVHWLVLVGICRGKFLMNDTTFKQRNKPVSWSSSSLVSKTDRFVAIDEVNTIFHSAGRMSFNIILIAVRSSFVSSNVWLVTELFIWTKSQKSDHARLDMSGNRGTCKRAFWKMYQRAVIEK